MASPLPEVSRCLQPGSGPGTQASCSGSGRWSVVWIVLAWLLALTPYALARCGGTAWGFEGVPWVPLALLPWIALAGWPRTSGHLPPLSVVGLMLPALGLALAADLAAGFLPRATIETALWGGILCGALAWAAQRGEALYGALWLVLVPGAALLLAALEFVGPLSAASSLARVLGSSPLAWPIERLHALRVFSPAGTAVPWGPLFVLALLVAIGRRSRPMRES